MKNLIFEQGKQKRHGFNLHRSLKRSSKTKRSQTIGLNSFRRTVRQKKHRSMNQLDQRNDPSAAVQGKTSLSSSPTPLRAFMCFLAQGNSSTRSVEASIAPKTLIQRLIYGEREMTPWSQTSQSTLLFFTVCACIYV